MVQVNLNNTLFHFPLQMGAFFRDGETISNNRINIATEGDATTLEISNVTKNDAGTYRVVAKNSAGRAKHAAELTVIEVEAPPSELAPLEQVQDIIVEEATFKPKKKILQTEEEGVSDIE